jgi:oligoendopeptidase F
MNRNPSSNRGPIVSRKPSSLVLQCGAAALLSMLSWPVLCQDKFEAIPKQSTAQYHLDFGRNFFASPEAEKADRANLYATLKELETLKGKVTGSPDSLQRALRLNDRVRVQLSRHYSYLYLRYAVNTNDEKSLAESSALVAEVNTHTAFLRPELMQIDDRKLAAFVSRQPSLKTYLFEIAAARRYLPYTLSLKEEESLSATAPNNDWQYDLYEKLRERLPPLTQRGSDQKAREETFKQRYAGLATQRDLFAFTLMRLASSRTRLAQLRHFADAPSEVYFNSYWSRAEVDELVDRLAQKADLCKRYQRVGEDHIKKITGYKEVNLWDMSVRSPGMRPPRYTIDQASQIIRDALAPLGPEYGRELAALLDPANGRMDIVPCEHRKRGGFSKGFIGTASVFYSGGFAGSYNDVRVLAHESTHAIHRQLMTRNHVLPVYAEGPHYLFEAFAIFSEFLLPDYLYKHESDPQLKQYYLEQFLEGKGMELFLIAPEVAVEHAVYDGIEKGTIKGADDLDSLTKRIYSRYSIWPEKHDELKATWINIGLMYEDPFYDINYVYGVLLALEFYELYTRDPQHFAPRYIALMRNGFDAPPDVLLKRFLGVDLHDPRLLSDALRILEEKVNLLEKSYQE